MCFLFQKVRKYQFDSSFLLYLIFSLLYMQTHPRAQKKQRKIRQISWSLFSAKAELSSSAHPASREIKHHRKFCLAAWPFWPYFWTTEGVKERWGLKQRSYSLVIQTPHLVITPNGVLELAPPGLGKQIVNTFLWIQWRYVGIWNQHGGNIYTKDIGKYYKSRIFFFLRSQLLNIY